MNRPNHNFVPFVPLVQGTNSTRSTSDHRYRLASNKAKKLDCPYCGAKKHWQLYIDIETGEVLPEQHGRCDNADKCGHQVTPKDTGFAKMIWEQERGKHSELLNNWRPQRKKVIPQPKPEPVFFDFETFKQTLQPERYEKNTFRQNLLHRVKFPFEAKDITRVFDSYQLGTVTNGYRAGANTFPFIDLKGNVRAVQVKQFDEQNHSTGTPIPLNRLIESHHRKNNKPLPEWIEAYNKNESTFSCLFGEQFLSKYQTAVVYLFEAPKTAVYGTLYFGHPEISNIICLAVGAKGWLNFDKAKVLQGRIVYVFPDLSKDGITFKEWETKVKEYGSRLPGTRFVFSDLLERLAPEQDKSEGKDLADYLIKLDWGLFRKRNIEKQPPQPKVEKVTKVVSQQNILFSNDKPLPNAEPLSVETIEEHREVAFIGEDGKVFMQTPFGETYTVYENKDQYNKRSKLPVFIPKNQINIPEIQAKDINLSTLTI